MVIKKPRVEFQSGGESGNIYYILALVRNALLKQHRIQEYNDLREAVTNSRSYTEALGHIRKKVELVDLDGKE